MPLFARGAPSAGSPAEAAIGTVQAMSSPTLAPVRVPRRGWRTAAVVSPTGHRSASPGRSQDPAGRRGRQSVTGSTRPGGRPATVGAELSAGVGDVLAD